MAAVKRRGPAMVRRVDADAAVALVQQEVADKAAAQANTEQSLQQVGGMYNEITTLMTPATDSGFAFAGGDGRVRIVFPNNGGEGFHGETLSAARAEILGEQILDAVRIARDAEDSNVDMIGRPSAILHMLGVSGSPN